MLIMVFIKDSALNIVLKNSNSVHCTTRAISNWQAFIVSIKIAGTSGYNLSMI